MIRYIICGFAVCVICKISMNLQALLYMKRFFKKFNNKYDKNSLVPDIKLSGYAIKLRELLQKAHVKPTTFLDRFTSMDTITNANPFDYLDRDIKVVNGKIESWVLQSIGVYKQRIIDAINPIYWIQAVLFLPQSIVRYFGGNYSSRLTKGFNFAWWVAIFISIFSSDIRNWIANFIK